MKKIYELSKDSGRVLAFFDSQFEIIEHVFDIYIIEGYYTVDIVRSKKDKQLYLTKRGYNYELDIGMFACQPIKLTVSTLKKVMDCCRISYRR